MFWNMRVIRTVCHHVSIIYECLPSPVTLDQCWPNTYDHYCPIPTKFGKCGAHTYILATTTDNLWFLQAHSLSHFLTTWIIHEHKADILAHSKPQTSKLNLCVFTQKNILKTRLLLFYLLDFFSALSETKIYYYSHGKTE